jgi:hypothetical protein
LAKLPRMHSATKTLAPILAALVLPWPAAALTNKVLIIGIDGTMPSAMTVARTPNLDALRASGAYSERALTHPITHSAACWTAMFTGVWGDKNGVNDPGNNFYNPRFDVYPNFMQRLETVNGNWSTVAFLRWAPLSAALGGTDVVQSFGSDDALVAATCNRLTNSNPDVFYTILLDVDSAGHSYGWGASVTNYVLAIEAADARVGQIMSALTNRVSYAQEDWLVIVLSDHGQHDSTLEQSRVTFHIVSGPAAARGEMHPSPAIVDVCATVLMHMGVPIDPAWDLDARIEGLPRPPASYGTNLVLNGDAEANSATNNYYLRDDNQNIDRGIAWWFDPSPITLGGYGAHPDFPSATSAGPAHRGQGFFLGAIGASNQISQWIDLSPLGAEIDDPGADCALSGFLGGMGSDPAEAVFSARFLSSSKTELGVASIGPVTPADRGHATGLIERTATCRLPPGTRLVQFLLTMRSPAVTNNASADNLSFVLTAVPEPAFEVAAPERIGPGWGLAVKDSRTNRLYILERSEAFPAWTPVTPPTLGTGGSLLLADTNPPPSRAFYRVKAQRP